MKRLALTALFAVVTLYGFTQKKPLDHSVYDGWQSIGNIALSNDGKWVVYNINVQEGDDQLVVQATDNSYKKIIPRGYDAKITMDSRSVVFRIKPLFKEIRQAKINKKKPADMPADTLAVLTPGKEEVLKIARLIS